MPILRANDADLFYSDAGQGETVLFLHGLGSSSVAWQPQIEALAPLYRVLALDARGSGKSRSLGHPTGPFSPRQFADDARALLESLGAAPAHVVGLSMGGIIAFQLAVDHPRALRTMTIVNSGPELVARTFKQRAMIALRLSVSRLYGPRGMARMLAPKLFPKPEHEWLREQFRSEMARNDKAAYIATQRALVGFSVLDRIAEIACPALIVASDQDYTPVEAKQAYARRMQHAEVVVVTDARHALPIEEPEKFNPILLDFLGRHAAQRT